MFFLDILIAPLDKQDDKITGSRSGVIVIAIATANVNASIGDPEYFFTSFFIRFQRKLTKLKSMIKRIKKSLIP